MNYATVTNDGSEFFSASELGCPAGGTCALIDDEIISEVLYYYKVSGIDGEGNMSPWTDASNGQWSYCYNPSPWEEK